MFTFLTKQKDLNPRKV